MRAFRRCQKLKLVVSVLSKEDLVGKGINAYCKIITHEQAKKLPELAKLAINKIKFMRKNPHIHLDPIKDILECLTESDKFFLVKELYIKESQENGPSQKPRKK